MASLDDHSNPLGLQFARAGARGVCAVLLLAFAYWGDLIPPDYDLHPIYAGALLAPASLLDSFVTTRRGWRAAVCAWSTAFALVALAQFQSVYTAGVLEAGGLLGGAETAWLEWQRLFSPLPGEGGSLMGLKHYDFAAALEACPTSSDSLPPDLPPPTHQVIPLQEPRT